MRFLGIRNGHDANICYTDGTRVLYHKLERALQIKHFEFHDSGGPDDIPMLLDYARDKMGVDLDALDAVCLNPDPGRHKLRPSPSWIPFRPVADEDYWKRAATDVRHEVDEFWKDNLKCPVWVVDHHYAHVLSCWPLWHEKPRVNFVFDGVGDHKRNTSVFVDDQLVHAIDFDEFPGLSMTMETWAKDCGIEGMKLDLSGKLMARAAYHNLPPEVLESLAIQTRPLMYWQMDGLHKECKLFADLFLQEEQGVINATHVLQEFCKVKIAELMDLYLSRGYNPWAFYNLGTSVREQITTYSGGTAQNTVVNTAIRKMFPNVIIPPHCPDDGISIGCVEFLRQQYDQEPFDKSGFPFWQADEAPPQRPSKYTIERAAEAIAKGKIVGWYQGHGEIGPRALGNRSILMDATLKAGKDVLNSKVKHRESYRPFGASVMKEYANEEFDFPYDSPFMLYVTDVRSDDYPAVTHVDGTCRIQTVDGNDPAFEDYYALLQEFEKLTGNPLFLNTSLNVNGKPIAGHLKDATDLFDSSAMDMLVMGDVVLEK